MQGLAAKQAKDSSVKKLLLIGAVPAVPENYFNVKTILDQLNMEAIEYTVSADVKMCMYYILFVYRAYLLGANIQPKIFARRVHSYL